MKLYFSKPNLLDRPSLFFSISRFILRGLNTLLGTVKLVPSGRPRRCLFLCPLFFSPNISFPAVALVPRDGDAPFSFFSLVPSQGCKKGPRSYPFFSLFSAASLERVSASALASPFQILGRQTTRALVRGAEWYAWPASGYRILGLSALHFFSLLPSGQATGYLALPGLFQSREAGLFSRVGSGSHRCHQLMSPGNAV